MERSCQAVMADLLTVLKPRVVQQVPYERLLNLMNAASSRGFGPAIHAVATGVWQVVSQYLTCSVGGISRAGFLTT